MDGINLSSEASEDNLCKPDWLRARDSLENLLVNRSGKVRVSLLLVLSIFFLINSLFLFKFSILFDICECMQFFRVLAEKF